jgi:hypothetical protein
MPMVTGAVLTGISEPAGGWESDICRLAVTGEEDLVFRLHEGAAGPSKAHREFPGICQLHTVG